MNKKKINPEIVETLEAYNIPINIGVLCLLAIYYNLTDLKEFEYVYEVTFKQINISKIVERDYMNNSVIWNIPLYLEEATQEKDENWEWVKTEYRELFKAYGIDKAGSNDSCIRRMKKFFTENPHIRKEDVMKAAIYYIKDTPDKKYLQAADYFIVKGKGVDKTSRLEQYLEIIKQNKPQRTQNKQSKPLR